MADAPDLGSGLARGIGSNPFPGKSLKTKELRKLNNDPNRRVAISLPFYCLFGKTRRQRGREFVDPAEAPAVAQAPGPIRKNAYC